MVPLIRKKKLGSVLWTFDAKSQVQLKRIFNTEEKQNDWPLKSTEEVLYRDTSIDIGHEDFFNLLLRAIAKITNTNIRFKFIWSLKRYSDDPEKIYAIFFSDQELGQEEINILREQKVLLGQFAGYFIVTRFNEFKFFQKAIEFYERFDQLILPDKTTPFLLFGTKTNTELVLLFYCDIGGGGMLIKSKSSDTSLSPEREIEILRLGSIIGVDVPQRSAVIKLNPDDEIVNEFSANQDNNVLIQKLIPGAYPLYSASPEDIEILTKTNCVNLGKMILFDIVAGSWDRHSGNYVLHPRGINEISLAEIDFGLFDPSWYPPVDFKEAENVGLDTDSTPPVYSPREGWALTRHPSVTEMVKNCDQKKVVKGIDQAVRSLQNFIKSNPTLTDIFSDELSQRIISLFEPGTKVRSLFISELKKLDIEFSLFEPNFDV